MEKANRTQICHEKVANTNISPARIPVEKSVIYKVDITEKVYDFLKFNPITSVISGRLAVISWHFRLYKGNQLSFKFITYTFYGLE